MSDSSPCVGLSTCFFEEVHHIMMLLKRSCIRTLFLLKDLLILLQLLIGAQRLLLACYSSFTVHDYMSMLRDYEEPSVSDHSRHSVHSINYYQVTMTMLPMIGVSLWCSLNHGSLRSFVFDLKILTDLTPKSSLTLSLLGWKINSHIFKWPMYIILIEPPYMACFTNLVNSA